MGAPNHYGVAELLQTAPKSPNNVTSTSFNTLHLLPKDFIFKHGSAELASYPGRHPTSLCPWSYNLDLCIIYFLRIVFNEEVMWWFVWKA